MGRGLGRMVSGTALLSLLALIAAACGGGPIGDVFVDRAADGQSGAVSDLDGVRDAVVRIVAEGSFVDPQVGQQLNVAGSGSGFIVDPSGIAVTNNHVVTGSALLRVHLEGEDRPRNAQVLGVSECSDLAVIDIEGDGHPYLEWYDGEIRTGLEVFSAGFPLGDPEYTLTRGIVSKERASGETNWASVNAVIEHDARIRGGNSGGPLVTPEGQVVGVNYAGSDLTDQNFAIRVDEARGLVEQLRSRQDVTSIGVNGEAVTDGESIFGIWVASVKSGSPADRSGIQGGDIITRMEGLVLAVDGTMSDYCDILRSRSADDVLSVEVLRFASGEVLEGQLNGRELAVTFSFASQLADDLPVEAAEDYGSFVTVVDDTGAIEVDIPREWGDVDGDPFDGALPAIAAAPSLVALEESWDVPGMVIVASSDLGTDHRSNLADFSQSEDCVSGGTSDYDDGLYEGLFEVWEGCGGTDTSVLVLSAAPYDGAFGILVLVQVVTSADLDALDQILRTFVVVGAV